MKQMVRLLYANLGMGIVDRVVARYAAKDDPRDRSTGKYLNTKWTRLCKLCGHPVGAHSAEKSRGQQPCFHGDNYLPGGICHCPVFTRTQKFMSDEDYARYEKGDFSPDELKALTVGVKSQAELKDLGDKLDEARPKKGA